MKIFLKGMVREKVLNSDEFRVTEYIRGKSTCFLKELLERIAREMVHNSDEIRVIEIVRGKTTCFHLRVANEDMARIIGRRGQTVNALREILHAAGARRGRYVELEVSPRKAPEPPVNPDLPPWV